MDSRARLALSVAALLGSSCGGPSGPSRAAAPAPAASPEALWHYDVSFEPERELSIEARFDAASDGLMEAYREVMPFVHGLEYEEQGAWHAASVRDTGWFVPCTTGCRVRYRFALREACRQLNEADSALASGDVLIAPPSTWLIHPGFSAKISEFELSVRVAPGSRFVTGFRAVGDAHELRYRARVAALDDASYAAFGPLEVADVPAGDGSVRLAVAPRGLGVDFEAAQAWARDSAGALAAYYGGHLPARRTLLVLMQGTGNNTRGLTLGGGGPGILIRAADTVGPSTTRDDWVVTHELVHANFPDLGWQHAWLSEGLATYIEPIARARVGLVSEAKVWRDLLDGTPQGLPRAGDQGLERTRTWGRTYWGGALFCLVADVTLREQSGNRRSLDDILLAIGKTSATDEDRWSIEQVLAQAEQATGSQVVRELYERLALRPGTVDLAQLFARLGVRAQGSSVAFDEHAPLAAIRHSIAARRPGSNVGVGQ